MKLPVEWLNSYLVKPLAVDKALEALELAGLEVEGVDDNDAIDVTSAANRWDLNGISWIAHEVSAQTGHALKPEHLNPVTSLTVGGKAGVQVEVAGQDLATRYLAVSLKVNNHSKTPEWMVRRLQAADIRPVSVVVDITNYCMLEFAQPLHAFDAAKVRQPIQVRLATAQERLTTLDGARHQLRPEDIVIADADGPIGLAGVMGGQNSEVSDSTTEIVLEAASFNGSRLRQSALHHRLRTDASARFERRIPPQSPPLALNRALELLAELAEGTVVGGVADWQAPTPGVTEVKFQPAKIEALLGIPVSASKVSAMLKKMGLEVRGSGPALTAVVPWWRPDVTTVEDLSEEIIKLEGYDKLPSTIPLWEPQQIEFDNTWAPRWQAKAILQSLGLFEVVTYSFISKNQIEALGRKPEQALKLKNPLTSEQAYLRTDLLPSLLQTAARNRAYGRHFGLYEFSKVYLPTSPGELPREQMRLGVLWRTQRGSFTQVKAGLDRLAEVFGVDYLIPADTVEPPALFPGRHGKIFAGTTDIGRIAQLNPSLVAGTKLDGEVSYLEIYWDAFLSVRHIAVHSAKALQPSVTRDLSVVVKREVSWQEIKMALAGHDISFVSDYYGDDVASTDKVVTLRLHLRAADRTLTDSEIDRKVAVVDQLLKQKVAARPRT